MSRQALCHDKLYITTSSHTTALRWQHSPSTSPLPLPTHTGPCHGGPTPGLIGPYRALQGLSGERGRAEQRGAVGLCPPPGLCGAAGARGCREGQVPAASPSPWADFSLP